MLIDKTYFVGELHIPNVSNANVEASLNLFIKKYEREFLIGLMGLDMYTAYKAGIITDPGPAVQIYVDINTGKDYVYLTKDYHWKGLIYTEDGVKESPIANYVYYWWMRNHETKTVGLGEVKPTAENANVVSGADKMVKAMSECREQVKAFHHFMNAATDVYTLWNKSYALDFYYEKIAGINAFNL